jgi:predicted amidohydrolase YtcJ
VKPVLLYNARFFDFVKPRRIFQAIEILNGQIHRLYKRKPREKHGVQSCDLKNKYVIPGFTDSHTHLKQQKKVVM